MINNSAFVLFGQDWSPFVSSTLPNMIENTNFGGVGFGAAYTRIPQAKFGFNHKFGGSRDFQFEPEIAIVLPAFGNLPTDVANQLAFGERQGADSQRPGIQGRAVFQWQLDKAAERGSGSIDLQLRTCAAHRDRYRRKRTRCI